MKSFRCYIVDAVYGSPVAHLTAFTDQDYSDRQTQTLLARIDYDWNEFKLTSYKKNKVFPIMHATAIRTDLVEANPWLPKTVFEMYSHAKAITYKNLATTTSLKVSLLWVTQEYEDTRRLMGENYWAYGIEANRKELGLVSGLPLTRA